MTDVGVLVLAWNGEAFLRPCLDALLRQQFSGQSAILVVDNGSTDRSVEIVREYAPAVALMQNRINLGFAGGNNVGLRALLRGNAPTPAQFRPDTVVLLNQDTEVAPDWLQRLHETLDRHPQAGIAGCKCFFSDHATLQHAGGQILWPLATGSHRGVGENDTGQYDAEEPLDFVTGAAMAIRTSLLDTIGLFDEGFSPAYYEDVDLCFRARAAGHEVIYTPDARLVHHEGTSLQSQSPAHQRAYHRNRVRFLLKHAAPAVLDEWVPAEHEEIARWSIADSLARKHAYFEALLALPRLVRQREEPDPTAAHRRLARSLRSLHQAVVEEERRQRAETRNNKIDSSDGA